MWSRVALLSFNWRAIGGYQSSIISVDGIFASQVPMSSLSSRLYLAYHERSVCMHEVLFRFCSVFSNDFRLNNSTINHLHQVHLLPYIEAQCHISKAFSQVCHFQTAAWP